MLRRSLGAGWLYADLLLVLLIAALGGALALSPAGHEGPGVPAPSVRGMATREPAPRLDPDPVLLSVDVDSAGLVAGRRSVVRRFRADLSEALAAALRSHDVAAGGARIGMTITFGYAPRLGAAQLVASRANDQAVRAEPAAFAGAVRKSYGNTNPGQDPDHVTFELYLLTE